MERLVVLLLCLTAVAGCMADPKAGVPDDASTGPPFAAYVDCSWPPPGAPVTCDARRQTRYTEVSPTFTERDSGWMCIHDEWPENLQYSEHRQLGDPRWKVLKKEAPLDLGVGWLLAVELDLGRMPGPFASFAGYQFPGEELDSTPYLDWWPVSGNRSFVPLPRVFTPPEDQLVLNVMVVQDSFVVGNATEPVNATADYSEARAATQSIVEAVGVEVGPHDLSIGRFLDGNAALENLVPTEIVYVDGNPRYLPTTVIPPHLFADVREDPGGGIVTYSHSSFLKRHWTNVTEGERSLQIVRNQPLQFWLQIDSVGDLRHRPCCSETPVASVDYLERCVLGRELPVPVQAPVFQEAGPARLQGRLA